MQLAILWTVLALFLPLLGPADASGDGELGLAYRAHCGQQPAGFSTDCAFSKGSLVELEVSALAFPFLTAT
jgi:hypothetical protein